MVLSSDSFLAVLNPGESLAVGLVSSCFRSIQAQDMSCLVMDVDSDCATLRRPGSASAS